MSIRSLPKAELHLHLEGAAPPAFIAGLAREKNIDIGGIFDAQGRYAYRNFVDFLRVYEAACTTLTSPRDFYRLTRAVLEESAAHGVIYSECFLSPDFCGGGDLAAWREYLAAIREAAEEARANDGIVLRGVVTCIRHFGPEQSRRIAHCAAETAGDWLTGFGMGGDEGQYSASDFTWAFDAAREAGLRLTSHAGEWGGPESVRETLDHLRVERVGHGVRAHEDPDLLHRIADEGVMLEVCPGSNVALGLYPDLAHHPIDRLREAGVAVSVSTDDPPFFHTDMTAEYEGLCRHRGWSEDDIAATTRAALDAAFCPDDIRQSLIRKLEPET
ncbi:adenosine deaminase [Brevirhabdus pacifica]|uniref:Adenosine deaminase n=1 Tax=Brevirhabdus pacifica TaxID=1267768 RepID=A0A1U7DK80_9RHOB|nr:adenosine deaminase [Brevirhabdus pacifica]APX90278.1 adenosine deaminase [Brevirhabdus pacifica]OWU78677.1 adenosine deaminase [Loktanella sp. 22II-4b]PJJ80725.1 adenosine deaminase [Brevirhabdus pacifica]